MTLYLPQILLGDISTRRATPKPHVVNHLMGDELVRVVRFRTPFRKFGHRRRGRFRLPPRRVLNLFGSLTTSALFRRQKCRCIAWPLDDRCQGVSNQSNWLKTAESAGSNLWAVKQQGSKIFCSGRPTIPR